MCHGGWKQLFVTWRWRRRKALPVPSAVVFIFSSKNNGGLNCWSHQVCGSSRLTRLITKPIVCQLAST